MKHIKPDFLRERRCGIPEVVYGMSKRAEDLEAMAKRIMAHNGRVIVTKIGGETASRLKEELRKTKGVSVEYNAASGVLVAKNRKGVKKTGLVGILSAGTSDAPVAEEARVILEELGCRVLVEYDVGVAGIHRLYPALRKMKKASALIVVAGMEGALPSVVSGLVKTPVIGVPTSVGYGVGAGGIAALYAMLNSCSPVAVVNVDNGYGAAALAYKIAVQHK
jgi:hypothetical protein